jgi:NADH:ubiquinone oxidoreductase subunit K
LAITLSHYLVLSAALFTIGLYGALAKRNAVTILMCLELMFNAANIAFVALTRAAAPQVLTGQVFALFVITVAAAEVAVGLAIVLAIYRQRRTIDATEIDLLKW